MGGAKGGDDLGNVIDGENYLLHLEGNFVLRYGAGVHRKVL